MSVTIYISTGEVRTYIPFDGITPHGFNQACRSLNDWPNDTFPAAPTGWSSVDKDQPPQGE